MTLPPLGPVSNDGRDPSRAPRVPYYSLWSAPNGTSGLASCALDGFEMKSVGGQAAPMWMRQIPGEVVAVFFTVLPVGWVGEWHESPKPQWVVPLSGHWFIETQDGSRVEMGPGDIHWGQDIDTRAVAGGRGHRSGQVGAEPCVPLLVQYKTPHGAGMSCPFS
ncbi:MAG: cupin domain-containing protein [Xanthobacteraceae bacterium]